MNKTSTPNRLIIIWENSRRSIIDTDKYPTTHTANGYLLSLATCPKCQGNDMDVECFVDHIGISFNNGLITCNRCAKTGLFTCTSRG